MPSFRVDGFWNALLGAIIIGVISVALNSLTGSGNSRIHIDRRRPPPPPPTGGGNGPVIDV